MKHNKKINLKNFNTVNNIYATYFNGDTPPARSTIEVSALPLNSLIETLEYYFNENPKLLIYISYKRRNESENNYFWIYSL